MSVFRDKPANAVDMFLYRGGPSTIVKLTHLIKLDQYLMADVMMTAQREELFYLIR